MKLHRWLKHILPATKKDIERLIMKEQELATALNNLTAQLQKANKELQDKIKALTDAIGSSDDVPQAVADAANGLTQAVQGIDDIVPDASPLQVPPGAGDQVPPANPAI